MVDFTLKKIGSHTNIEKVPFFLYFGTVRLTHKANASQGLDTSIRSRNTLKMKISEGFLVVHLSF